MPAINVFLEGDNCWPDLKKGDERIIHLGNDSPPIGIAALPGGMVPSRRTSLMFRLDLPDGTVVMAETSLALLENAVRAIRARHPY